MHFFFPSEYSRSHQGCKTKQKQQTETEKWKSTHTKIRSSRAKYNASTINYFLVFFPTLWLKKEEKKKKEDQKKSCLGVFLHRPMLKKLIYIYKKKKKKVIVTTRKKTQSEAFGIVIIASYCPSPEHLGLKPVVCCVKSCLSGLLSAKA